jgi:hypothetical protein
MSADRPQVRTGLGQADNHASWREVYSARNVDVDQHEDRPEIDVVDEEGR